MIVREQSLFRVIKKGKLWIAMIAHIIKERKDRLLLPIALLGAQHDA